MNPLTPGEAGSVPLDLPASSIEALDALYQRVPDSNCKGLCAFACRTIDPGPTERARLSDAGFEMHDWSEGPPDDNAPCPALGDDGRCNAYEVRPAICRLWGSWIGMACRYGCVPSGGYLDPTVASEVMERSQQL